MRKYTIHVTDDAQIPGMTEFKVMRDDVENGSVELMKFASFNIRKSMKLAADYLADSVIADKGKEGVSCQ